VLVYLIACGHEGRLSLVAIGRSGGALAGRQDLVKPGQGIFEGAHPYLIVRGVRTRSYLKCRVYMAQQLAQSASGGVGSYGPAIPHRETREDDDYGGQDDRDNAEEVREVVARHVITMVGGETPRQP